MFVTRGANLPDHHLVHLARQIFGFEFMNEPDFVIDEWERDLSSRVARPLPFAVFAEAVSRFSDLVHDNSPALVTLGGARLHVLEDALRRGEPDVIETVRSVGFRLASS